MSQLPRVASFQDLVVYRKAREFSREIFLLTRSFPKEETYSLIDQVRHSSRSIGANLAEVWAKRRYEKHFISKLTDADGEQQETQHWIGIALDCGYLNSVQAEQLVAKCKEIGRMLGGMIERADTFWDESSHCTSCPQNILPTLLTHYPTDPLSHCSTVLLTIGGLNDKRTQPTSC